MCSLESVEGICVICLRSGAVTSTANRDFLDVLPASGTFPECSRKAQVDHSPLLQTANETESFIEFCFPSFKQQLNCNYTQSFVFLLILLSGEESYFFLLQRK